MTYKKYIRKNGKLYGPYIYSSKRVDGKVVSEYYGAKDKNFNYKTFLFILAGVVLLATLIFFFISLNKGITGKVVLGLDTSYEEGKPLDGVLRFSLKEGELMPEDTHIIFENSGGIYNFVLKDILDEESVEGSYYVYGKEIQGNGLGYGIEGEEIIYPEVEFILQVYSDSEGGKEVITEDNPPETNGGSSESSGEIIPEGIVSEENESNEVVLEEIIPEESTPEEIPEETIEEQTESNEIIPEEPVEEVVLEEIIPEESTPEEIPEETIAEESNPAPITGNFVKNSGGIFSSFFRLTGMVSLELENEINGVASKDNSFVYELKSGETAELKPRSVKIGDEVVEDGIVSLNIEDGKVIVSTDYSEVKKGYGEGYTGNNEKTISLDLYDLSLFLEEGDLTVKLVYGEEELVHLTTFLENGQKASNETVINIEYVENETEENESTETPIEIELNETLTKDNETIKEIINSSLWEMSDFLTSEEREILIDEFENISLQTTKSEIFSGRIIKGYALDKYYVEYSYDSSLIEDVLEVQMERDRIKFLKDVARSISKEKVLPENLEDNESYTF